MKKYKGTIRNKEGSTIPKMVTNVSKDFPDQLFLIKSDKKRPHIRLEQKMKVVFYKFMKEYESYKDGNIKNFEKTTKMVL